ncbi:A/G-specific adenine glycosylase [Allobranchiibius sp. CTAmp26]|uniref:A/G-specific adenine glycosylase n=1 Tax=Allobranchiibius sp. CTAmp26 TaxID=2815214 RepID=UPI0027DC084E|nr:A/G-specific adenine glycosylase [Allobranchiibius sp. CTAmp26]
MTATDHAVLHRPVLDWYAEQRRDLPWRSPGATPWGVFVSEVMLQQTPVVRVLPVWTQWMTRWPTPADLAAAAPGDAVRHWGRLGYPRRALRLHAAATAMVASHDGAVPDDLEQLRALPGVGSYTAAAVGAFAFGIRCAVVDTNVRRVHARCVTGSAQAAPALTAAESRLAEELLPPDDAKAAVWNVAVMELGALVCTAASPTCDRCPIADRCAWVAAGRPAYDGPVKRAQRWAGTDRQVRGLLLQALRDADGPVEQARLDLVWADAAQRGRCLAGLIEDGLIDPLPDRAYALPG